MLEVTPIQFATETLPAALAAGVSVLAYGPPGVGKTTLVRDHVPASHRLVEINMGAISDADFGGVAVPDFTTSKMVFTRPAWLPDDAETAPLLIFCDEVSMASIDAQRLLTSLALDKSIRGYRCHPASVVVMTANRLIDGTRAVPVLSTVRGRCLTCTVLPDVPSWLAWASQAGVNRAIATLIAGKPDQLSEPIPADPESSYRSPRTWHLLSRLLDGIDVATVEGQTKAHALALGTVGTQAAAALAEHLLTFADGFDAATVLSDPDNATLPQTVADCEIYASAVMRLLTPQLAAGGAADAVTAFVTWLALWPMPELAMAQITCLLSVNASLVKHPMVKQFIINARKRS